MKASKQCHQHAFFDSMCMSSLLALDKYEHWFAVFIIISQYYIVFVLLCQLTPLLKNWKKKCSGLGKAISQRSEIAFLKNRHELKNCIKNCIKVLYKNCITVLLPVNEKNMRHSFYPQLWPKSWQNDKSSKNIVAFMYVNMDTLSENIL